MALAIKNVKNQIAFSRSSSYSGQGLISSVLPMSISSIIYTVPSGRLAKVAFPLIAFSATGLARMSYQLPTAGGGVTSSGSMQGVGLASFCPVVVTAGGVTSTIVNASTVPAFGFSTFFSSTDYSRQSQYLSQQFFSSAAYPLLSADMSYNAVNRVAHVGLSSSVYGMFPASYISPSYNSVSTFSNMFLQAGDTIAISGVCGFSISWVNSGILFVNSSTTTSQVFYEYDSLGRLYSYFSYYTNFYGPLVSTRMQNSLLLTVNYSLLVIEESAA